MPLNPDVVLNAGSDPAAVSIKKLIDFLADKKIIPSSQGFELGGQRIKELFMVGEEEKIRFFQKSQNGRPGIDITLVDLQWIQVLSEGWATL
uniref:ABC transporter substrate-binding protein n=1 Tax=Ditylenchus dipsaci TaxID=166011 RepID=A0A915CUK8_9BILA